MNKLSQDQIDQMCALFAEGWSVRKTAAQLRIDKNTVNSYFNKFKRGDADEPTPDEIAEAQARRLSEADINKRLFELRAMENAAGVPLQPEFEQERQRILFYRLELDVQKFLSVRPYSRQLELRPILRRALRKDPGAVEETVLL